MERKGIVNELHRSARKNFIRRHVNVKKINDLWQADLVDMQLFAKENKNYKYLLTVIDVFSKKAFVKPIKNKSAGMVTDAMANIFKENNQVPVYLQTDNGTEFHNKIFKQLMKKHNITFYSTYSILKASVVERFNRTLKNKMWKQFSLQGSYKWLDILSFLVDEYNKTKHRTIGMAPNQVNKNNEISILRKVYNKTTKWVKNKFQIGDIVRISKY